ncbi:MAG: hypothetical protein LBQ42_12550 [Synergistaceae bacterium]|jgi:hypothetical protein|nr:hypothetical protein [Synergistaceae bacterium]
MRARDIKPGFFKNEELAECSLAARLLFPGLWMLADREGRLEDRPKRIKGEIFPYDAFDIDALLDELAQHGFIQRYAVNDVKYIQIMNFLKHQRPHNNETQSVIPPCSEALSTIAESAFDHGEKDLQPCDEALRSSSLSPSSLSPPSLSIAQPAVAPDMDEPTAEPMEPQKPPSEKTARPKKPPEPVEYSEAFERLWAIYPRRVDKQRAFEVWQRIRAPDHERVITAARNYAAEMRRVQKDPEFILYPKTFLNKNTWEEWEHGSPEADVGGVTNAEKAAIIAKYTDEEGQRDDRSILREIRAIERERGVKQAV